VRATGIRLHALASASWILEVEGLRLSGGEPVARCSPLFFRVTPQELVERCAASHGLPATSYLGVSTPALIFRDLQVAG